MARAVTRRSRKFSPICTAPAASNLHFGAQVAAVEGSERAYRRGARQWRRVLTPIWWCSASAPAPMTPTAAAAGLACDRGIIVDACAGLPRENVVAAGDCTVLAARGWRDAAARKRAERGGAGQGRRRRPAWAAKNRSSPRPGSGRTSMTSNCRWRARRRALISRSPAISARTPSRCSIIAAKSWSSVELVNRPGDHLLARRLLDAGLSPLPSTPRDLAAT